MIDEIILIKDNDEDMKWQPPYLNNKYMHAISFIHFIHSFRNGVNIHPNKKKNSKNKS